MKFGELIASLAEKAGIKKDDELLKKLLASPDSLIEVPKEFSDPFEQNLLTTASALNNPAVLGKIRSETLNGLDAEFDRFVTASPLFDDTFKNEYKGIEKNTNEKFRRISASMGAKLEDIKKNAAAPKDPTKAEREAEVLKNELQLANQKLANMETSHKVELDNQIKKNLDDKKDFTLTSFVSNMPLPNNGLPREINILTAKTLLKEEMGKKNLALHYNDAGQPVLKQVKDGVEVEFYDNNKPISYNDFISGTLAANKFVQVTDSKGQTPPPGNTPSQQTTTSPTNARVAGEIDKQLQQLAEMGMTV